MPKLPVFYCDCNFHKIDVDTVPLDWDNGQKLPVIGLTIYEHVSGNTGKKLKRPREMGTVVLIGDEAIKFRNEIMKVQEGVKLKRKYIK